MGERRQSLGWNDVSSVMKDTMDTLRDLELRERRDSLFDLSLLQEKSKLFSLQSSFEEIDNRMNQVPKAPRPIIEGLPEKKLKNPFAKEDWDCHKKQVFAPVKRRCSMTPRIGVQKTFESQSLSEYGSKLKVKRSSVTRLPSIYNASERATSPTRGHPEVDRMSFASTRSVPEHKIGAFRMKQNMKNTEVEKISASDSNKASIPRQKQITFGAKPAKDCQLEKFTDFPQIKKRCSVPENTLLSKQVDVSTTWKKTATRFITVALGQHIKMVRIGQKRKSPEFEQSGHKEIVVVSSDMGDVGTETKTGSQEKSVVAGNVFGEYKNGVKRLEKGVNTEVGC
ncbi:predicted protein [Nematostella vectensis]|uniref:Uncharacterized protein n=1 Tax=Nematostella vectensis TaxID=45351 RepID=A7STV1_NEMVE|nr:predicted protein [Nematostella vectensis]|eukprot:XP_001624983.1 predicted protein [Nematostella vectensis]